MAKEKLTSKQELFCYKYVKLLNQTQAAIEAGYSPKTANTKACELMKIPGIKEKIEELKKEIMQGDVAEATEVAEYLTSVMRGKCTEQVLIGIAPGVQMVTDMDVSARDRIKSAELLGKLHGMFKENHTINGAVGVTITGKDDIPE